MTSTQTRSQLIDEILILVHPQHPREFRQWLDKLDDAELGREYREIVEAFAAERDTGDRRAA